MDSLRWCDYTSQIGRPITPVDVWAYITREMLTAPPAHVVVWMVYARRIDCDTQADALIADPAHVNRPRLVSMQFRLSAPELELSVDVRLRSFGERWMAVAEVAGDTELGLGATAREALAAALMSLGEAATTALLADPALFGPSTAVIAAESVRRQRSS